MAILMPWPYHMTTTKYCYVYEDEDGLAWATLTIALAEQMLPVKLQNLRQTTIGDPKSLLHVPLKCTPTARESFNTPSQWSMVNTVGWTVWIGCDDVVR
jgi:hypothetical protein